MCCAKNADDDLNVCTVPLNYMIRVGAGVMGTRGKCAEGLQYCGRIGAEH